jgi:hypothetical protein
LANHDGCSEVQERQGRERGQRAPIVDQPIAAVPVVPEDREVDQPHEEDEPVVVHEARVLEQPASRRRKSRRGGRRSPDRCAGRNGMGARCRVHGTHDDGAQPAIPDARCAPLAE